MLKKAVIKYCLKKHNCFVTGDIISTMRLDINTQKDLKTWNEIVEKTEEY
jgi:hypothetical protein